MAAGDAGDWLADILSRAAPHGRLVFHTIAAQYFPEATRARIAAALAQAAAAARPDAPLAHLELENADGDGAVLALRLWNGQSCRMWRLARASAHVTWIDWNPQEIAGWSHR